MTTVTTSFVSGAFALTLLAALTLPVLADRELPASRAVYEIRHGSRMERMEVKRTGERVEHHYLDRDMVEVWQRGHAFELEHWKVFPREGRSVHYAPGDLRTLHVAPAWEQLATLVDPAARAALTAARTQRAAGGATLLLEGQIAGQPARILWNEQRGWAEEIALGAGSGRTRYRLLSATPCTHAACEPLRLKALREIEFADLGDAERDPFVRRFLARFASHAH